MNKLTNHLLLKKAMPDNVLSRRQFVGRIMFATAGAALMTSCKTHRYRIGCYTRPWSKYDYRVAFDGIAGAGFKYAGLMTTDKGLLIKRETTIEESLEIGQEAKSRGLKIASAYCSIDVKKSVADGIAGMMKIIDNLHACGCTNMLLGGIGNPDLEADYYKVVAECCDYAAEKGVLVTVKPHGGLNATGRQCRSIIERVNHRNFRLTYDPGNIYFYSDGELDPVDDSKEVDGIVAGMCVKDFKLPKNVNVTPGTGMVDFSKVLANLQQGGYTQGPLVVECLDPGDADIANAEAIKARKFLEELVG